MTSAAFIWGLPDSVIMGGIEGYWDTSNLTFERIVHGAAPATPLWVIGELIDQAYIRDLITEDEMDSIRRKVGLS